MLFETIGIKDGKQYKIGMRNNGTLYGDEFAIELIKKENDVDHGYLGLAPGAIKGGYLGYAFAAADLSKLIFDTVISHECPLYRKMRKEEKRARKKGLFIIY